jgi:3-methylfumaryl-CoA hydratase
MFSACRGPIEMAEDLGALKAWVGRRETAFDTAHPGPVAALAATFDREDPPPRQGDPVPPGWHWLYFLTAARRSELGPDGHPKRGGFLPPVPLPRRMWAGGRLSFHRPIPVGAELCRESEIADVAVKQGRSGPLVFVTARHQIRDSSGLLTTEEHDIVYRGPAGTAAAPDPAPIDSDWRRTIDPDPVLLFRFSALTFNGHRIHYDQPYATQIEGYPGLVVHGPMIALLLLELCRDSLPDRTVHRFDFQARRPLFDTAPFVVAGRAEGDGAAALWAETPDGGQAMTARAVFAT